MDALEQVQDDLVIEKGSKVRLENMVLAGNHEGLIEIFLEDITTDYDKFFVPIGKEGCIGYLRFRRVEKEVFELESLEQADFPNPHPQLLLSGVLYSRRVALEVHQSLTAYIQGLN